MRHRASLLFLCALLGFGCSVGGTGSEEDVSDQQDSLESADHQRADRALENMMLTYWRQSDAYMTGATGDATPAGYWIFAQAFDAVLDGVERTHGAHFGGLVETLYRAQDARGWSRDFFDDETWMTLALVRAYDWNKDPKYLARAESLFADVMINGWDDTCCGSHKGGVWWDKAHSQKATASNLGPVIAAVRLSERTGKSAYLTFAKKAYDYWSVAAVNPSSHAVADHMLPNGELVWWRFSYNEALFVGSSVELWRATHDVAYLDSARSTAAYMLAHETTTTSDGLVLFDGTDAKCTGDCSAFKGIAYRYLAELYEADPSQTAIENVLVASARSVWDHAHDGSTGLFSADWAGPPEATVTLASDASAAMALNLRAMMESPYATSTPSNVYEAEDAVLNGVGLEAKQAGFDGWGYVAGFHADGQSVAFTVNVASAGKYDLRLRYAAGSGVAKREILLNGKPILGNLAFPSTGGWNRYAAVFPVVHLPAGRSVVTVAYRAASGSENYLNLDRLTLVPSP